MEQILRFSHLFNLLMFNQINLILAYRTNVAHLLMNCILKYCPNSEPENKKGEEDTETTGGGDDKDQEDDSSKDSFKVNFRTRILYTISVTLRNQASLIPFLSDKRDYLDIIL